MSPRLRNSRLRKFQLRNFTTGTIKAVGFFGWAASCAWLFQEYCYNWTSSRGVSMYPTLGYETKYNILNKRHRLGRNLKVGDLIVAKHPCFPRCNAGKRVIALPGDFVVRDPSGSRTVGGMSVEGRAGEGGGGRPPSSVGEGEKEADREEPEMVEVPPGHVWVAGDNLAWSRDSRFYGPLPMGLIVGKIVRYSNPSSDWMIDMVRVEKDQLSPASLGMGGGGNGDDDWMLATRSFSGWEKTTNIKEFDLKAQEQS